MILSFPSDKMSQSFSGCQCDLPVTVMQSLATRFSIDQPCGTADLTLRLLQFADRVCVCLFRNLPVQTPQDQPLHRR